MVATSAVHCGGRALKSRLVADSSCADYLRHAERRLNEEASRVQHYLAVRTAPRIRAIVQARLVRAQMATLVAMEGSGLVQMLEAEQLADLRRMYTLFRCATATAAATAATNQSLAGSHHLWRWGNWLAAAMWRAGQSCCGKSWRATWRTSARSLCRTLKSRRTR